MSPPESVLERLRGEGGAWAVEHLQADLVGWLTTVAPDGRVQSSAVSFLWDGSTILLYSQPNTPKLRNIAAHPQVSFTLNTDTYGDHLLIIEGTAEVDPSTPGWDVNEPFESKFREAILHWGMAAVSEVAQDFSVPVRITPTRIRAW